MNDLLDSGRRLLSINPQRWRSLLEAAPSELLSRAPASGEWSAADCLNHLLLTERNVFGFRLRAILDGRDLVSFDPQGSSEGGPTRTPRQVVADLASEREGNLAILATLADADLDRTGRHPEYGPVALGVVLNTWIAHDLQHTVQAEEALMQAFIPSTGPFRYRFAAHDVQPSA